MAAEGHLGVPTEKEGHHGRRGGSQGLGNNLAVEDEASPNLCSRSASLLGWAGIGCRSADLADAAAVALLA